MHWVCKAVGMTLVGLDPMALSAEEQIADHCAPDRACINFLCTGMLLTWSQHTHKKLLKVEALSTEVFVLLAYIVSVPAHTILSSA